MRKQKLSPPARTPLSEQQQEAPVGILPVSLSAPINCNRSLPSSTGVNAAINETYCKRPKDKSGSWGGKEQNKQT